jgi:hypothetical protein
MTTRQLSRLFRETAEAAGTKKGVTLHKLRHSFCSRNCSGTGRRACQKGDNYFCARAPRMSAGFTAPWPSPFCASAVVPK